MDVSVKIFYSLLFGILNCLLLLIFSEQINDKKKLEIGFGVVLAILLVVNAFSSTSRFVPSSEIWQLVVFDFSIPILYVTIRRQSSSFRNDTIGVMNDNVFFSGLKKFRDSVFLRLFIIGVYVFQLVSIWLLTERYLMEAKWQ